MNKFDINRVTIIYIDKKVMIEGASDRPVISNINSNDLPQSFKNVYSNIYSIDNQLNIKMTQGTLTLQLNEVYSWQDYEIVDVVPFANYSNMDMKVINQIKKRYSIGYDYLLNYPDGYKRKQPFTYYNEKIYNRYLKMTSVLDICETELSNKKLEYTNKINEYERELKDYEDKMKKELSKIELEYNSKMNKQKRRIEELERLNEEKVKVLENIDEVIEKKKKEYHSLCVDGKKNIDNWLDSYKEKANEIKEKLYKDNQEKKQRYDKEYTNLLGKLNTLKDDIDKVEQQKIDEVYPRYQEMLDKIEELSKYIEDLENMSSVVISNPLSLQDKTLKLLAINYNAFMQPKGIQICEISNMVSKYGYSIFS